ncbi:MAG: hypothetical protein WC310_02235 [Patescibacteria group bacterium]|jgi:hypothetical protein
MLRRGVNHVNYSGGDFSEGRPSKNNLVIEMFGSEEAFREAERQMMADLEAREKTAKEKRQHELYGDKRSKKEIEKAKQQEYRLAVRWRMLSGIQEAAPVAGFAVGDKITPLRVVGPTERVEEDEQIWIHRPCIDAWHGPIMVRWPEGAGFLPTSLKPGKSYTVTKVARYGWFNKYVGADADPFFGNLLRSYTVEEFYYVQLIQLAGQGDKWYSAPFFVRFGLCAEGQDPFPAKLNRLFRDGRGDWVKKISGKPIKQKKKK